MTTANKTIKINDVEAAKKLVSAAVRCPFDIDIVKEKFLLMPNLFSEY
jgi:hypothetical protein